MITVHTWEETGSIHEYPEADSFQPEFDTGAICVLRQNDVLAYYPSGSVVRVVKTP